MPSAADNKIDGHGERKVPNVKCIFDVANEQLLRQLQRGPTDSVRVRALCSRSSLYFFLHAIGTLYLFSPVHLRPRTHCSFGGTMERRHLCPATVRTSQILVRIRWRGPLAGSMDLG